MIEHFNKGNRNPEFLIKLISNAIQTEDQNLSTYCSEYFKTQTNLLTNTNVELIIATTKDPYSKEFKYLLANERDIAQTIDKKEYSHAINNVILSFLDTKVDANDPFEKFIAVVDKTFNDLKPSLSYKYRDAIAISYAKVNNDAALLEKHTLAFMTKYQETLSWSELNEMAWNFFEMVDNKESLKAALRWAMKSVDLETNFHNNDTVAHLYNKLGDKRNARLYAKEAFRLGTAAGEDTSGTEELLEKLK